MKALNSFIIERLKLNTQSKLKNWAIEDIKDGDILTFKSPDDPKDLRIFIFGSLEKKSNGLVEIFAHAYYDAYYDIDSPWAASFLGTKSEKILVIKNIYFNEKYFYPSNKEEKEKLFDRINKNHHKWDPIKKEIKKI